MEEAWGEASVHGSMGLTHPGTQQFRLKACPWGWVCRHWGGGTVVCLDGPQLERAQASLCSGMERETHVWPQDGPATPACGRVVSCGSYGSSRPHTNHPAHCLRLKRCERPTVIGVRMAAPFVTSHSFCVRFPLRVLHFGNIPRFRKAEISL